VRHSLAVPVSISRARAPASPQACWAVSEDAVNIIANRRNDETFPLRYSTLRLIPPLQSWPRKVSPLSVLWDELGDLFIFGSFYTLLFWYRRLVLLLGTYIETLFWDFLSAGLQNHLEGWVMLYNSPPPSYITGYYMEFYVI
jgi:hypothetical protein